MLDKNRLRIFVLGGIAGALAGVLFAPKSGKELRGSIASRAGEARERGRETYFEAQELVQERIAEVRERSVRPEGDAAESLPRFEPTGPEGGLHPEPPAGKSSGPPPLRDVSWEGPRTASGEEPDLKEVRRRVRETRSRLRARLDGRKPEGAPGDRDE